MVPRTKWCLHCILFYFHLFRIPEELSYFYKNLTVFLFFKKRIYSTIIFNQTVNSDNVFFSAFWNHFFESIFTSILFLSFFLSNISISFVFNFLLFYFTTCYVVEALTKGLKKDDSVRMNDLGHSNSSITNWRKPSW